MNDSQPPIHDEHKEVLDSIRPSKIIIPTIIGIIVIGYLVIKELNIEEFFAIKGTISGAAWLILAGLLYLGRHMMYSYRLKILSEGHFSWMKSIELVTILEFASSVSPTNFGGSAVAFFMLIQENITGAKATAMVLYTIIADTLFFVFAIPFLFLVFGRVVFFPTAEGHLMWRGMEETLFFVWLVMAAYGFVLFYGLFVRPKHLRRLLETFSKWRIFGRTREKILQAALDIEKSSVQLRQQPYHFHGKLIAATLLAWIMRFGCVTAILLAFDPNIITSFMDHIIMLGRGVALYSVSAYSPTPGGSGVAEIIFGQFYSEYVSKGIAVLAAFLWRMITYYPYLILGVIIIPNWIRKILNKKRTHES